MINAPSSLVCAVAGCEAGPRGGGGEKKSRKEERENLRRICVLRFVSFAHMIVYDLKQAFS